MDGSDFQEGRVLVERYKIRLSDGSVRGENLTVLLSEEGLRLHIKGVPFLKTTKMAMPDPRTGLWHDETREVPFHVPPGSSIQIDLSEDGVVSIFQLK